MRWIGVGVLWASVAFAQVSVPPAAPAPSSSEPSGVNFAPPSSGQAWSVVGARTVGNGQNALELGVGFPQLSAAFLHGVAPNLDLGVRAGFAYGLESMVTSVIPGLKLNLLAKLKLLDTGKLALGLTAEPGLILAFNNGNYLSGLALPVGFRASFAPASSLAIGFTLDLPFWVNFGYFNVAPSGVYVPILAGLGVEYFVKSDFLLFFRVKVGPELKPYSRADLALDATMGLGLKL
jgi:hypothetical protein